MSASSRKELLRAYRERPRDRGVFVVRCTATGQAWVGSTPNLASQKNSLWFSLRMGGCRNRDLQAAYTAHGAEALVYEVVEAIDDADLTPLGLKDLLKAREGHWREALAAGPVHG